MTGRGFLEDDSRICRYILLAVLFVSLMLRIVLVFSGGQKYWPDEGSRYGISYNTAQALLANDAHTALRIFDQADHILFQVIGVIPALFQLVFWPSLKMPALFFSFFSVLNLWILWLLMTRMGEGRRAALFAVIFLAYSSTFFYYSRHLLPYDMAMALGLLALWIGLRRPSRVIDSALCGFLSGCAFLTYNGYFLLAGAVLVVHIVWLSRDWGSWLRRAGISGISFMAPLIVIAGLSLLSEGTFLEHFIAFSKTVVQGEYAEGWKLPFAFLWHAEHLFVVFWIGAVIHASRQWGLGRQKSAAVLGLLGVALIYGGLVVFSVGLGKFVVYGRMARQLVPFFCILSALFLEEILAMPKIGRRLAGGILVFGLLQAAVNFYQPLTQVFPDDFREMAERVISEDPQGVYQVFFAKHLYPVPAAFNYYGRVILRRRHPLEFLPYQYEGYTFEERRQLRTMDIRMSLVAY